VELAYFTENPSQITENIYIGTSKLVASQRTYLKCQLGISHLVNCTMTPNPLLLDHFESFHAKLMDEPYQDIIPHLSRVINFIRRVVVAKGKVMVYSDRGVSRSVAMVLAFLIDTRNMTFFEASILVKEKRYIANPNRGFVRQLARWGANLRTLRNLKMVSIIHSLEREVERAEGAEGGSERRERRERRALCYTHTWLAFFNPARKATVSVSLWVVHHRPPRGGH